MPKPVALLYGLYLAAALSACTATLHQQAFYVSPFNGSPEGYHALPTHTDRVRTAAYARVSGFGGSAHPGKIYAILAGGDGYEGQFLSIGVHLSFWRRQTTG